MKHSFAQRLASLMNEKEVSQYALGTAIGATRQSIAQYLEGKTQPSAEKLCAIADYFDVTTDYLLGRSECRAKDVEIQALCQKTGLSEAAINVLVSYAHDERGEHGAHYGALKPDQKVCTRCATLTYIDRFLRHEDMPRIAGCTMIMAYELCNDVKKEAVLQHLREGEDSKEFSRYVFSSQDLVHAYEYRNSIFFSELTTDIAVNLSGVKHVVTPEEASKKFLD